MKKRKDDIVDMSIINKPKLHKNLNPSAKAIEVQRRYERLLNKRRSKQ